MGNQSTHVAVIGGGFGGLYAAKQLSKEGFSVTLIDRRNFHLFQPLLYQVATGFLAPGDIAVPLRTLLAKYPRTRVIQDSVSEIDFEKREVITESMRIPYDYVVIATGVTHSYFGKDEWAENAPGLKSIEDAFKIRARILSSFEAAERAQSDEERRRLLTFIIVGGGPTGVEMAGAVAELSRATLKGEFRSFDPGMAKIILCEGGDRILPAFHPSLSRYAKQSLERLGADVRLQARVTGVGDCFVELLENGETKRIAAGAIVWAAGVRATSLAKNLHEKVGAGLDRGGRVIVQSDLTIPSRDDVFVIGDLAYLQRSDGTPLPGVAPVAMQQGRYVAKSLARKARGLRVRPFKYFDKGNMAVIGKGRAVAESWHIRMKGFIAWVAWAFVHILFLIEFEDKLSVFIQWGWNYMTNKRSSRLITRA